MASQTSEDGLTIERVGVEDVLSDDEVIQEQESDNTNDEMSVDSTKAESFRLPRGSMRSPISPTSSTAHTLSSTTGTHHRNTSSITSFPTTILSKSPPSGSPPPLPEIYVSPEHDEQQRIPFRIPLEILINIALFLPTATRIKLSHVCRSYRHYLINEPRLWKTIYLPLFINTVDEEGFMRSHVDKLRSFLQRSKGGSISISLEWKPPVEVWEVWLDWKRQNYHTHCEKCFSILMRELFQIVSSSREEENEVTGTSPSAHSSPILAGRPSSGTSESTESSITPSQSHSYSQSRLKYPPFTLKTLAFILRPPGNEVSWNYLSTFLHMVSKSDEHIENLVINTGFEAMSLKNVSLFFARNVENVLFTSDGVMMERNHVWEKFVDPSSHKVVHQSKRTIRNANAMQAAWYDQKSQVLADLEPEVNNGFIESWWLIEVKDESKHGQVSYERKFWRKDLFYDFGNITTMGNDRQLSKLYLGTISPLVKLSLHGTRIDKTFRLPPLPLLEILELEGCQWAGRGWVAVLRSAQKSLRVLRASDFVVDDVDKDRIGEAEDYQNWCQFVRDIPIDLDSEDIERIIEEERKRFPFWNDQVVFIPRPLVMEKLETFACLGVSTPIWTSLHNWIDMDEDEEYDHEETEDDDDVFLEDFGMDDDNGTELEDNDPDNILDEELEDAGDQTFMEVLESMGGSPKSKNRAMVKRRSRKLEKLISIMRKKRLPTPEILMPRVQEVDVSSIDVFGYLGRWAGVSFSQWIGGIGYSIWKSGGYDNKPDCAVFRAWLMDMLDREGEEGYHLGRLANWSNGGVPVDEDDIYDPSSSVGYAIALGKNISCNGHEADIQHLVMEDDELMDDEGRWRRFSFMRSHLDDAALIGFMEAGMGIGMRLGRREQRSEKRFWNVALDIRNTHVSDRAICKLPVLCPSLKELDVRGSGHITCRGIARMVEKFRESSNGMRRLHRVYVTEPDKTTFGIKCDYAVGGHWPKSIVKDLILRDSFSRNDGGGSSASKVEEKPIDPEEAKLASLRLGNGTGKLQPWESAESVQWEYRAFDWLCWVEAIPFSPYIDLQTFTDEERMLMGLAPLEPAKWDNIILASVWQSRNPPSRAERLGKLPESYLTIGCKSQGAIGWGLGLGLSQMPPWRWA